MRNARWLLILLSAPGCGLGDECSTEGGRCDGNIAVNCMQDSNAVVAGRNRETVRTCGTAACIAPSQSGHRHAFCALAATPDPKCPAELRTELSAQGCADGLVVAWRVGFRTAEQNCDVGLQCVDQQTAGFDPSCSGRAFCAEANPSPACSGNTARVCLDENRITQCACNFLADPHNCENPGPLCVVETAANGTESAVCRP